MNSKIKIGTRGSQLALWQANYVAGLLEKQGLETAIVIIETKGDKNLLQPFSEIGTKGIFTEEIEHQLISGDIDIAVHSAKDMQSNLGDTLEIIAFTHREDPSDVLVNFNKDLVLTDSKSPYIIGTSSARRRAILKANFPHLRLAEARGNLQTRIRKMEEGQYDAMILAFAGIHRMGYDYLIIEQLPLHQFIPAVGQGSIAIEAATSLPTKKKDIIRQTLNHRESEERLLCERAFLRMLEGGCSIPIFGLATVVGDQLTLNAGVANHSGSKIIRDIFTGPRNMPEELGNKLAKHIMTNGGEEVLKELKNKGCVLS